jgi:hypothetical protein
VSRIALPSYAMLETYYPTDPDSEKVIRQLGGELTQSWVGSNSCVMRMCKAFNSVGKQHEIPESHKGFLTVLGGDQKNYAIRVMDFIHYLHKRYRAPDIVKTGSHMVAASFAGKKGIIAWHIDGWNDARGHFTLWDGSNGLFEGAHHYFDEFRPSTPKGKPHMTRVEFWTC